MTISRNPPLTAYPQRGVFPNADDCMDAACDSYGVLIEHVRGQSKDPLFVSARWMFVALCRDCAHLSFPEVMLALGRPGRKHTTALGAVQGFRARLATDPDLRERYTKAQAAVAAKAGERVAGYERVHAEARAAMAAPLAEPAPSIGSGYVRLPECLLGPLRVPQPRPTSPPSRKLPRTILPDEGEVLEAYRQLAAAEGDEVEWPDLDGRVISGEFRFLLVDLLNKLESASRASTPDHAALALLPGEKEAA